MTAHPNTNQADRDRLADPDLLDLDDRVGTGHGAHGVTEEVAP